MTRHTFAMTATIVGLAVAAWPTESKAASIVYEVTPFSVQQTNAVYAPSSPGFNLFTTTWQITNSSGEAWDNAYVWYPGAQMITATTDELSQWDNALQSWSTSNATMRPANHSGFLPLALSNITIPNGLGIEPTDSLPVWFIGDLLPGASVLLSVEREVSNNVIGFYTQGLYVTTAAAVPEPASLSLLGLGLAVTAARHRRARRMQRRA